MQHVKAVWIAGSAVHLRDRFTYKLGDRRRILHQCPQLLFQHGNVALATCDLIAVDAPVEGQIAELGQQGAESNAIGLVRDAVRAYPTLGGSVRRRRRKDERKRPRIKWQTPIIVGNQELV